MYKLPVRNIPWRSIRRVRTDSEEAQYHGFDTTARSLINHIYQGGTADVSKTMMIRCMPYCRWIGARLLLNIHDELLFEVPSSRTMEFIRTMQRLLNFHPILVGGFRSWSNLSMVPGLVRWQTPTVEAGTWTTSTTKCPRSLGLARWIGEKLVYI